MTIKDIAKICNVGISTVSRAINNDPRINPKTKEKIMKVVREYHYVPNNSARNLKVQETNTIVLLMVGIDNLFFQNMVRCFEQEFSKLGYTFALNTVSEDQNVEDIAVGVAKEKRPKGIIILGGRISKPKLRLADMGIPYVLCTVALNMDAPQRTCNSVSIDDEKEAYKAVSYLISRGHRRIAIITGKEKDRAVGGQRLLGYRKALEDNGIEYDPALVGYMKDYLQEFSIANGYAVMRDLLRSGVDFTAVFAISDLTAFGAYKAILESGRKIPEDYSVIGFDGIEMTRYMEPSLTTVGQPIDEMVRSTINLLLQAIEGEDKNEQMIYEASLIERDSVRTIEGSE